jgi:hypothetical protein
MYFIKNVYDYISEAVLSSSIYDVFSNKDCFEEILTAQSIWLKIILYNRGLLDTATV